MVIEKPLLIQLQKLAAFACRNRPYRLEIWITGAGHVIADVHWHDDEFKIYEYLGSVQIGWDLASMYFKKGKP